jgi:hypothetical protein
MSVLNRSFTAYLQQAGVQDDKIQGFAKGIVIFFRIFTGK